MAAFHTNLDPSWTLAAVRDGAVSVCEDWPEVIADDRLESLTALEPDLDLLYHRPRFHPASGAESEDKRARRFTAEGAVRAGIFASALLFAVYVTLVVSAALENSQGQVDAGQLTIRSIYILVFAWLSVRTLVFALVRSGVRCTEDEFAPHGVRLDVSLVCNRLLGPKTVRFAFQPTAILLVNRHYPGEENIPTNHPRHEAAPWTDAAILAIGTNSEFAVIGCHRTLDLAREVIRASGICTELTARGVPVLEAPPEVCLGLPPRPPLPDEKRQWKAVISDVDLPPLTPGELRILFDALDQPSPTPFEHTLDRTIEILEANQMPVETTLEWLKRNGGFCDCEVVINTAAQWAEWANGQPENYE